MERAAEKLNPKLVQLRVSDAQQLPAIEHFPFMMQLMASLESIRASLRWLEFLDGEDSTVRWRDRFTAVIAGAGWSAEAFRLLKKGAEECVIERRMIKTNEELVTLWDRVMSHPQDDLLRKVHRIRDKYFVHWDAEVMENFIQLQTTEAQIGPLIETDADWKFLNTRYLWPNVAFAVDFVGNPAEPGFEQEMGRLFGELQTLWMQTADLLSLLLRTMIQESGLELERVEVSGN